MAKRTATSELNHDNWDREDEPEDSGTFSRAAEDVIKTRVIKVAKRRNPISSSEEGKSNAFGGFTGFSKSTPAISNSSNTFSFLTNLTSKKEEPKTNGTTTTVSTSNITTNVTPLNVAKENDDKHKSTYFAKLKGLNESVSKWISKHVAQNALVNLQPIFRDYDKYFAELEKLKGEEQTKVPTTKPQFSFGTTTTSATNTSVVAGNATIIPKFNFGSGTVPKFSFGATDAGDSAATNFSFGKKVGEVAPSNSSASSFSSTTSTVSTFGDSGTNLSSKGFTFGAPLGGTFANVSTVTPVKTTENVDSTENNEEVNEDEPPKTEFTPVVEEGHVYTIRCKVFVKKDGAFGDRGVGNLYLKPVPKKEKFQLIVRADTNLGNLLCNFILSEGLPMQRMGKKDVMLVCIPTPESKPPPVPILLRVKATEDADELLKTLQKYQK